MAQLTPEQNLLLGRRIHLHSEWLAPADAVERYAGDGVTLLIWRWRVSCGWPLLVGLETNYVLPTLPPEVEAKSRQHRMEMPGRKSYYRGVTWDRERGLWRTRVCSKGRSHHLGLFRSEEMAANAYDIGAMIEHGPDAKLNFTSPRPLQKKTPQTT